MPRHVLDRNAVRQNVEHFTLTIILYLESHEMLTTARVSIVDRELIQRKQAEETGEEQR